MTYEIICKFEETIADYAGAEYGVAVESCTFAIFLCCKYLKVETVMLPKFTYPGVACSVIHAGGKIIFEDNDWEGCYQLNPYPIWDSAMRFQKDMYVKNSYYCLSFQNKKHLPIGRGGMILCDDWGFVEWARKARLDGRDYRPEGEGPITMLGWNAYMTPEQAARGLMLFEAAKNKQLPDLDKRLQNYPDLSKVEAYR